MARQRPKGHGQKRTKKAIARNGRKAVARKGQKAMARKRPKGHGQKHAKRPWPEKGQQAMARKGQKAMARKVPISKLMRIQLQIEISPCLGSIRFSSSSMRVPRNVERLVWRSGTAARIKNRRKLVTYFEYKVSAGRRAVPYTGKHGTVHSDIRVAKLQYRGRAGEALQLVRRRLMKLTPKKAGDTDRLDLTVALPAGAGWGTDIVASRIFAFHFLNCAMKLSKTEFQRPHPYVKSSYHWHVDHTNNNWRRTLAAHLKIQPWYKNQSWAATRRSSTRPSARAAVVMRRPAMAASAASTARAPMRCRKRPAAAGSSDRAVARVLAARRANLEAAERHAREDPRNDPVRHARSRFHVRALAARALEAGGLSEAARNRLAELCEMERQRRLLKTKHWR